MNRILGGLCVAMAFVTISAEAQEQNARGPDAKSLAATDGAALSKTSMKWLAGGVALYPDPVLEKVLEAAQTPEAIHQAAEALEGPDGPAAHDRLPESVAYLARKYPQSLRALDANPGLVSRLGREFRENPAQVWSAIDAFRSEVDSRRAATPKDSSAATSHEEASQAASSALLGSETQSQLGGDAAATTPLMTAAPVASAGLAIAPSGGTTVIAGNPAYPVGYGYSEGFYPSGEGGFVRRGWYGHGAFDRVYHSNAGVSAFGRGAAGSSAADFHHDGSSSWSHHGGRYEHADAESVNAANRSLGRNWSGLHHGEHGHSGTHESNHHRSSEHHSGHHGSAVHHGAGHGSHSHAGAHHGGKGGHHGGGHHGGKK